MPLTLFVLVLVLYIRLSLHYKGPHRFTMFNYLVLYKLVNNVSPGGPLTATHYPQRLALLITCNFIQYK